MLLKELFAFVILLYLIDVTFCQEGAWNLSLTHEELNGRTYCRPKSDKSEHHVAFINRKDFVWDCKNIAHTVFFMVQWSESEINSLVSKIEYLYASILFIENTMAERIDFSSLKHIDNVTLEIKHNPKLKTILFRKDALTFSDSIIYLFGSPQFTDESMPVIKNHCIEYCARARTTEMPIKREKDRSTGLEWCSFDSRGAKATYYKPNPLLTTCPGMFYMKIYMIGWPVAEIQKVLSSIHSLYYVAILIAHTDIETVDLTSMAYVNIFHLYLLDNPKLKDVYFSDVVRNTKKLRDSVTVISFNNPKMSLKSAEYLKLFCNYACLIENANLKPTPPTTTAKIATQLPLIVGTEPMPVKEMMISHRPWIIGQEDQPIPVTEAHEESVETTTESIDEDSHATSSSILLIPAVLLAILLGDF
ncbi:unnamed protein product [Caenorhabditis bovis]|uniref:Receptor L-domain domain-containing protein n=1 Tax=Caenorhabditis bovis TaxID=2654633 RepID=A0A8S1E546_9PELO|nr:unnamed protein product [Caenorhabditis bovis]